MQTLHEGDSQNKDMEQTKALLSRIKFLRAFYHSLVLLDKRTLSDLEKADLKLSQSVSLLQSDQAFHIFSPVATPQLIPYHTCHKLCSDSTAKMNSNMMFIASGKQYDNYSNVYHREIIL